VLVDVTLPKVICGGGSIKFDCIHASLNVGFPVPGEPWAPVFVAEPGIP
jgi:hypothetical protein